ncbi:MAG TPA: peptidylprolyl isomerase [Herbaspirillum sp.]|jgi:peptidylprolyl isomerase
MKSNAKLFPAARTVIGVLLASLIGAAAAQTPAGDAAGPVVASMGSIKIGAGEIQRMLQDAPEADRAAAKSNHAGVENLLRQRLTTEAVLREARSKGWADKPEVKARIETATREISTRIITAAFLESTVQIPADYPSEADTKAAYDQAKASLNVPAAYHVAQIFLKAPSGDKAAIASAGDKAKKLAAQARKGDFAAIARTDSQDATSAEHGGDVGTLPLANMLPEMRDVVAKMKSGQVSDPVQSPAGFHIVKLIDAQPARTATYEEVKPRLQALLRQQRQQQALQTYLAGLAPAGSMNIDTAALDATLSKIN